MAQASICGAATPSPQDAGADVVASLVTVERNLTSTKYRHNARIDAHKGIYEWDCSIMAAWVLRRVAPRARAAIAEHIRSHQDRLWAGVSVVLMRVSVPLWQKQKKP